MLLPLLAQLPKNVKESLEKVAGSVTGLTTPPQIEDLIANIIGYFLGALGVIFLGLAVYGGFIWMKARGNEKEVERAKNILTDSIIGIIIVFAAYAISTFIINALKPS